jgi:hypothetical protein
VSGDSLSTSKEENKNFTKRRILDVNTANFASNVKQMRRAQLVRRSNHTMTTVFQNKTNLKDDLGEVRHYKHYLFGGLTEQAFKQSAPKGGIQILHGPPTHAPSNELIEVTTSHITLKNPKEDLDKVRGIIFTVQDSKMAKLNVI